MCPTYIKIKQITCDPLSSFFQVTKTDYTTLMLYKYKELTHQTVRYKMAFLHITLNNPNQANLLTTLISYSDNLKC